jgi:hypothetical protein
MSPLCKLGVADGGRLDALVCAARRANTTVKSCEVAECGFHWGPTSNRSQGKMNLPLDRMG